VGKTEEIAITHKLYTGMANIDNIIPHIIKWEAATKGQNMTNEQLFDKAKLNGYANDHNDRGGATMVGITI
jgi:hypothetical protein